MFKIIDAIYIQQFNLILIMVISYPFKVTLIIHPMYIKFFSYNNLYVLYGLFE